MKSVRVIFWLLYDFIEIFVENAFDERKTMKLPKIDQIGGENALNEFVRVRSCNSVHVKCNSVVGIALTNVHGTLRGTKNLT